MTQSQIDLVKKIRAILERKGVILFYSLSPRIHIDCADITIRTVRENCITCLQCGNTVEFDIPFSCLSDYVLTLILDGLKRQ